METPDFAPVHALCAKIGARAVRISPMPGGASTRQYFRVELEPREDDPTTAVAMFVPDGTKADEIGKGSALRRWPFLEVQELLAARGICVPTLHGENVDRGWLLLEDLGDDTLAQVIQRSPQRKPALYARAVRDLARAQEALETLPEGSVVRGRTFDQDLLSWEMDHFREWGLDARGKRFSSEARLAFDRVALRIARRIAELPRGFTHRDYQSRNLMVKGDELVWIDFQDALLGPKVYDLVALLNDSYQSFERDFVEHCLDEFAAEAQLTHRAREDLGVQFDLVTIQRKLKDAGRFVFIDRVKANPSFLGFVTPTLRKVGASIARLDRVDADVAELGRVLRTIVADELGE